MSLYFHNRVIDLWLCVAASHSLSDTQQARLRLFSQPHAFPAPGGGEITGAAGPPPIWNNGSILLPGVPGPGSVGMLGIPGLHGGSGSRPSRPASQTLITCPPAAYHFKIMTFQERRAAMVQSKKIKQRLVLSSSGGVGESGGGGFTSSHSGGHTAAASRTENMGINCIIKAVL